LCYGREGRERDAKESFRHGLHSAEKALMEDQNNGRERANLAYFEVRLGDFRRAESEIAEALQGPLDDDTRQMAVLTYETLGRRDKALTLLEASPSILGQLTWFPELEKLQHDPKFTELLNPTTFSKQRENIWR
jgi:tetratricopeptide (TPR) repeat protein